MPLPMADAKGLSGRFSPWMLQVVNLIFRYKYANN